MKSICIECGDKLVGRGDKKFCGDHCRATYNYRLNRDSTNFMRNINNTLRRNRRILQGLNPRGKTTIHRNQLLEQGFKFSYFTNEYVTRSGHKYHFCYDQGYLQLDNNLYALVKRQEYVE